MFKFSPGFLQVFSRFSPGTARPPDRVDALIKLYRRQDYDSMTRYCVYLHTLFCVGGEYS